MVEERSAKSRVSGRQTATRVAAALALLGLIAFASTTRQHGGGSVGPTTAGGIALVVLTAVVFVAVVIGLVSAGYTSTAETSARTKVVVGVLVALLLAALIALFFVPRPRQTGFVKRSCAPVVSWSGFLSDTIACKPTPFPGGSAAAGQHSHGAVGGSDKAAWVAAASLSALLVLALLAGLVAARRRAPLDEPTPEDPVIEALTESIDDLRREQDVRRAIIACYARMERALARAGASRRAYETPFEYLARVLEHVAREPGRVLTDLFERAKFSTEPMGERDKEQAIAALEALRDASAPQELAA